jgi:hypothetical protein
MVLLYATVVGWHAACNFPGKRDIKRFDGNLSNDHWSEYHDDLGHE